MSAPAGVVAYVPQAAVIRLASPLGDDVSPRETVARALTLPAALAGACEPVELTLLLASHAAGMPLPDHERPPRQPAWQLVEEGLPPSIVVRAPAPGARRDDVASLDSDTVAAWAARALEQPPPAPGLEVSLAWLYAGYTRTGVSALPPGAERYVVLDGARPVEAPVQWRDGTAWVLAPPHDLLMQPPVSWRVGRDVDLYAELWVNWSPWLDVGLPEGDGVRTAVARLQSSGWTLREPVPELELEP